MRPRISSRGWSSIVGFIFAVAVYSTGGQVWAELQVYDELLSLNGTAVNEKTTPLDQFLFMFNVSFDNGFILGGANDAVPPEKASGRSGSSLKSISMHGKAFNIIIDGESLNGEASVIGGIFPGDETAREATRRDGFFYLLPLLGHEVTGDLGTDFGALFRSIDFRAVLDNGLFIELAVYRDGTLMEVLRSSDPGVEMPRDAYILISQIPCDDVEWVLEFRTTFEVSSEELQEDPAKQNGGVVITVPFKLVTGVHVSELRTGAFARPTRLTQVAAILDPREDLCPSDTEPWWLDGPDPNQPPRDAGETCFDVDYITDFDLFGFAPTDGLGGGLLNSAFPAVLAENFHRDYIAWFAYNALRNSGYRLLDTVNLDRQVPAIEDVEPLSSIFTDSYDGVPLIIAQQVEYLRVGGLAISPGKTGGVGLVNFLRALTQQDYNGFLRRLRIYVKGPTGLPQQVTLPQLMQTVVRQTWNKAPAYEGANDLLIDHPRIDRGELEPMRVMLCAQVRHLGSWMPLKAVISMQAGLYVTNVYGGCIFGVESVCSQVY